MPREIVKQMLTLATSGFSFVAALAWNETIQEAINTYIKPFVPGGSAVVSQLIYAMIITILAVTVTYQLSKLTNRLSEEKRETKRKKH